MTNSLKPVMVWLIYSMFFDYSQLPGYSDKRTAVLDTLQNAFEAGIPIGLTNSEFAKDNGITKEIIQNYLKGHGTRMKENITNLELD